VVPPRRLRVRRLGVSSGPTGPATGDCRVRGKRGFRPNHLIWLRISPRPDSARQVLRSFAVCGSRLLMARRGCLRNSSTRATARRGKSASRGNARKTSKSARGKAAKRTVARSKLRKSLAAEAKSKRARAKKVARRRKALPTKKPSTPTVVDAIEEPASGAMVVTDVEAAEVREPSADPEQPAEDQN
jgi:hypothetical protein